jgi:hypothetical protein
MSRPGDILVLGRWESGCRLGAALAAAAGPGLPDVFDPARLKPLFQELFRRNPSLRLDEGLRKRPGTVTP